MSQFERYAWLSLAAWCLILFFLLTRFTAGFEILGQSLGLTVVEQPASKLLWTYVTVAVLAAIAEIVVIVPLTVGSANGQVQKDERDHMIDSRANAAGYWFTAAALNVIVIHVLANAAYGRHIMPVLDLTGVTGIAFALLLVLTLSEIVKRIAVVWQYRRA
jgi:hypothetical protein